MGCSSIFREERVGICGPVLLLSQFVHFHIVLSSSSSSILLLIYIYSLILLLRICELNFLLVKLKFAFCFLRFFPSLQNVPSFSVHRYRKRYGSHRSGARTVRARSRSVKKHMRSESSNSRFLRIRTKSVAVSLLYVLAILFLCTGIANGTDRIAPVREPFGHGAHP